jgi:hypothetical protein
MTLKKYLRQLIFSSFALGSLLLHALPTYALPGQSLKVIRQEAKKSFVLPPNLVYNDEFDAYTGIRTIDDGVLAMYVRVRPQDQVSTQEMFVIQRKAPNLAFVRNDAEGLRLIERMYNAQIANDFRTSKYVAQIGEADFYQGKQFVYITYNQPTEGIWRFSVLPLDALQTAIKREVYCQANECVGYQPFLPIRGAIGS